MSGFEPPPMPIESPPAQPPPPPTSPNADRLSPQMAQSMYSHSSRQVSFPTQPLASMYMASPSFEQQHSPPGWMTSVRHFPPPSMIRPPIRSPWPIGPMRRMPWMGPLRGRPPFPPPVGTGGLLGKRKITDGTSEEGAIGKKKLKRLKKARKLQESADGENKAMLEEEDGEVRRAKKRRPLALKRAKLWNRADAVKALQAEMEIRKSKKEDRILMITFPDPVISCAMVESLDPAITKPHFQLPCVPRYCFFQVKDGFDVDEVINRMNEMDFLNLGKLSVKRKTRTAQDLPPSPEKIDPYTLYLGNLPLTVNASAVKEKFKTATRVDIGYAQKLKYTRYAFIGYQTVEDAIDAYKNAIDISFDSRTCVLRFRRQKAYIEDGIHASPIKSLNDEQMRELQKIERMEPIEKTPLPPDEPKENKKFSVVNLMEEKKVEVCDEEEEKEVDDNVNEEEDDTDNDDIDETLLQRNSELGKDFDEKGKKGEFDDDEDEGNEDDELFHPNITIKSEPLSTVIKTEPVDEYFKCNGEFYEEKEVDDEVVDESD